MFVLLGPSISKKTTKHDEKPNQAGGAKIRNLCLHMKDFNEIYF